MVNRTTLACLAALLMTLPGADASATPGDTLGLGTRNTSLGGAVTADVADVGANYYNPAGIVRGESLRLSIGYVSLSPVLSINGTDSQLERISGVTVGIVAPLAIGDFRFGFGLGLHLPDQRLSRTRSTATARPRWELYDTRPHKVLLSTNFGVRPVDWLSIGVGVTFQSASDLVFDVGGEANFFQVRNTRLRHQFLGDLASSRHFQFGVQVDPFEDHEFAVGISFRQELELRNFLTARVDADVVAGGIQTPLAFRLFTESVSTYQPHMLTIGFATRPNRRLRASLDLTWMMWSKHPSLVPLEIITLDVDLDSLGFPVEVPDAIEGRTPIPLGLRDTVVPRIGLEYDAVDNERYLFQVRGGYVYERTPFPTQTGVTDFVDSDRHSITLGAGLQLRDLRPTLPGALQFDAYFLYARMPERNHIKESLVNVVGDYVAGGHQWGFGLGVEVSFE